MRRIDAVVQAAEIGLNLLVTCRDLLLIKPIGLQRLRKGEQMLLSIIAL